MRVGGVAVLAPASRPPDASSVGILGSGGMARTCLEAFQVVRPIKRAKVFSPTPANRNRFAAEMSVKLDIAVEPVATAREAVRGVDILATCTDSMSPTFVSEWLEPGMHVTMIGPRELSQEALDRCDVKIRQGSGGVKMAESERVKYEIGHSPRLCGRHARRDEAASSKTAEAVSAAIIRIIATCHRQSSGQDPKRPDNIYHNLGNQACTQPSAGWFTAKPKPRVSAANFRPNGCCIRD
jgi:alanine dehydrogenase